MRDIFRVITAVICIAVTAMIIMLLVFLFTGRPVFIEHAVSQLIDWQRGSGGETQGDTETDVDNTDANANADIDSDADDSNGSTAAGNVNTSVDNDDIVINQQPSDTSSSDMQESEGEDSNIACLAFAGDVMFPDNYLSAYDQSGISAIADDEMLKDMQEADLFILNEEFPFSLRGEPMADKQFTYRTDPRYVQILQELGTDIVTLANNHTLDYGRDAFTDTLETLDHAGIRRIGGGYNIAEASAPAVCTVNGLSFAIFGATRVSPSADWYAGPEQSGLFQTYDASRLNEAIQNAKQSYDYVIVYVHWGIEKNETPEEYQRTLAKAYIDAGADLVVGAHPHVLQGFEYYKGVPIIYSLGNYLFDNRTGETLLLETTFSRDASPKVQLVPCQRSNGVLTKLKDTAALYQKLTDLSFDVSVDTDGVLQPE